jgi:hypothetical protein
MAPERRECEPAAGQGCRKAGRDLGLAAVRAFAKLAMLGFVLCLPLSASAARGGDCDDANAAVNPGQAEVASNRRDDDCDRLADEDAAGNPSTDPGDTDMDGQGLVSGDCDDTRAQTIAGGAELAGNRIDDNCSGLTDEAVDGTPTTDRQDLDLDGYDIGPVLFSAGFEAGE